MLKKRFIQPLHLQRGDTIVEVLISLAVISVILGGAYVTTNKSLLATRSAQERSSALKLAESQLEKLKGVIATDPNAVFGAAAPAPFCVHNNVVTGTLHIVAATDANCTVDAAGTATTVEPSYRLSVTRSGNDFTVRNSWTNVSGESTDQLQLRYRVYR